MTTKEKIIYIITDCVNTTVTESTKFADLPLDSMDCAEIATVMEFEFDFKLSQYTWNLFWKNKENTVADLINVIYNQIKKQ